MVVDMVAEMEVNMEADMVSNKVADMVLEHFRLFTQVYCSEAV